MPLALTHASPQESPPASAAGSSLAERERRRPSVGAAPLAMLGADSAGLAVRRVLVAVRAVLLELQAVRVVPPVLLRDVVTVLALHASHGDLRTNVGGGHARVPLSYRD